MLLPPSVAPVFISYRRADARHVAARLRDSLTGFDHRVWFDVDDVPSAAPYRTQITTALRECEVAVVLIGPKWATIVDAQGRRRLDNPDDDVRLELELALQRSDLTLVPVLVDDANMPARDELPGELSRLCDLNAARLSHEAWRYQVRALHETIQQAARRGWGAWLEAVGVAAAVALPAAALVTLLPATENQSDPAFAGENIAKLAAQRALLWALVLAAILGWVAWRRPGHRWVPAVSAGLLWGALFGVLGAVVHGVPTYGNREALDGLASLQASDGTTLEAGVVGAFALGTAITGACVGGLIGAAWNPPGVKRGIATGLVAGFLIGAGTRLLAGHRDDVALDIFTAIVLALGIVGAVVAVQWISRLAGSRSERT
ncbi:MAG: toll/interleukin-1 receptor domain-containing protein [Solirubrobacteraceae bacterium]|nr:toll/interleukin-1 receptor domain-containing protein [Solirubrobacteraceae bacterium]